MKKNLLMGALCLYGCLYSQYSDKIGINTQFPESDLHVNGTFKVSKLVLEQDFSTIGEEEDYTFLLKSPNNDIITYNQFLSFGSESSPNFVAPLNLLQFKITTDSKDKDWIYEFDTKIDADRFAVIISSFGFNLPVNSGSDHTPVPQIFPFIKDNKWFLKADYAGFSPQGNSADVGQWILNLLVFDRSYAKMTETALVDYSKLTTNELPVDTIKL